MKYFLEPLFYVLTVIAAFVAFFFIGIFVIIYKILEIPFGYNHDKTKLRDY